MGSLFRKLASVVVVLDEEENPPVVDELAVDTASTEPQPVIEEDAGNTPPPASVALADVYAAAKIPASPFPVERLIKLLDGLRAMDTSIRKAAILAMDVADDTWTIDDPLLDAEKKIHALMDRQQTLKKQAQAAEVRGKKQIKENDSRLERATAEIQQQMQQLQQLLQREITQAGERRAAIEAEILTAATTCTTESSNISKEIVRLHETITIFSAAGATTAAAANPTSNTH
jgi:hypothetical protein